MSCVAAVATQAQVTDVWDFELSPDGEWVVYSTLREVISVRLSSGLVRTLYPDDGSVVADGRLQISPDSSHVYFQANSEADGTHVFLVPIQGGSSPLKLSSGVFASGFGNGNPRVSPDGEWVTWSVGTYFGFGGSHIALADGSGASSWFGGYDVTFVDGGDRFLYRIGGGDEYFFAPTSLYVRPSDGSAAPVRLGPYVEGKETTVALYGLLPDESRVVYLSDEEICNHLFVVPTDGSSAPVRISDAMAVDRDVSFGFHVTPNATRVVYAADRDANELHELFVVPIDGSAPAVQLSGNMVSGGDVALALNGGVFGGAPVVRITPDSSRLVYVADLDVDERRELYSVPLDGSAASVKLNGPMVANGNVTRDLNGVRITPDGTRVLYLADQDQAARVQLYSVPIDGSGPAVPLAGILDSGESVQPGFVILEGEPSVLFRANLTHHTKMELWIAPVDGSRPPRRRCAAPHAAGNVQADLRVAPGEEHVFYRSDEDADESFELFRFRIPRLPHLVRR